MGVHDGFSRFCETVVAGPVVLLARDSDRIADRLAFLRDQVKAAVAEADDELAGFILRAEADVLALAAELFFAAPKEIDEVLGLGGLRGAHQGNGRHCSREHYSALFVQHALQTPTSVKTPALISRMVLGRFPLNRWLSNLRGMLRQFE